MADNLQGKMFSGMLWTFVRQFSMQGFAFVEGIILARILSPSDYGLIAMTTFFFAITGCFTDSGFSSALIRKKERTSEDFSTVFVTNVGMTFLFAVILCACSPLIAQFYNEPILVYIVCANAVLLFLNSFFSIQNTKLSKDHDFKAQNLIRLITNVTIGIVTIGMAISGFGIWSLVWPNFLMPFMAGYMYWRHSHWFPGFKFSKKSWKEFFDYGSKILGTNLLNTIYDNIYPLIIGKKYAATQLGYYTRAVGYATLPSFTLCTVLGPVAFPVLSTIQDDDMRLRDAYRRLIRVSGYVVFPLMMLLVALAKPAVVTLVTEKWLPSVAYLQILCFAFMWNPIQMLNLDLLQVKGRSDLFLRLEIIKKSLSLGVLFLSMPYGLLVMCVGQVVSSLICFVLNTYYTGKLINVGFCIQFMDLVPSLAYSVSMCFIVIGCNLMVESMWLQLVIGVSVGCIYYYTISKLTKSSELQYLQLVIKENFYKRLHKEK